MRKQQEALLQSVRKYANPSDKQIAFLSREDLHMETLRVAYAYFRAQNANNVDKAITLAEAAKWVEFVERLIKNGDLSSKDVGTLLYKLLPCEIRELDTLIGSDIKEHVYTAYKHFVNIVEINKDSAQLSTIRQNAFYDYKLICVLLYKHTDIQLIKKLFEVRGNHWEPLDMLFIFRTYQCVYDDYVHNVEKSLLWELIHRDLVGDFSVDSEYFEKLYDYDNHRFVIDINNFRKYFRMEEWGAIKLNGAAIANDRVKEYPLITKVHQFCVQNHLTKSRSQSPDDDFYCDWYTYRLSNPEIEAKIHQCYQMLHSRFTLYEPAWYLNVDIGCNFFISIVYCEYSKIEVGPSYSSVWSTGQPYTKYQLLVAPDGKMYIKPNRGKAIPVSMKTFLKLHNKQTLIGDLLKLIVKLHAKTNPFFNDVISDCSNGIVMPMNYNDIFDYHNRSHFIKSKYKAANNVQINWNKQNINLSYLILKALPKVEQSTSRQILIQQKDINLLPPLTEKSSWQDKVRDFLINIICDNVMKSELRQTKETYNELETKYTNALLDTVASDIFGEERAEWVRYQIQQEMNVSGIRGRVADYVNMCLRTKTKVRLDVRSIRQAINLHDMMAENREHQYQSTAQVKIPKDSKFNKLREILPEEFEWIKTRKRLIIETELQHHCVWSYATKITNDKCAIYSYVDKDSQHSDDGKPKRYTIEFAVDKVGRYKIVQIQGRYDREHTNAMTKYVQQLLDKAQSKK